MPMQSPTAPNGTCTTPFCESTRRFWYPLGLYGFGCCSITRLAPVALPSSPELTRYCLYTSLFYGSIFYVLIVFINSADLQFIFSFSYWLIRTRMSSFVAAATDFFYFGCWTGGLKFVAWFCDRLLWFVGIFLTISRSSRLVWLALLYLLGPASWLLMYTLIFSYLLCARFDFVPSSAFLSACLAL